MTDNPQTWAELIALPCPYTYGEAWLRGLDYLAWWERWHPRPRATVILPRGQK